MQTVLALIPIPAIVLIFAVLRTEHTHPHTYEERYLWQTNLYLNLILFYLFLEVAFPLIRKVSDSIVVEFGLHCDFFALWSAALTCLLPIELSISSGDVTLNRPALVALYLTLCILLVLRIHNFFKFCRTR